MQEEVEQRTVTLIVNTAKLTERELQKAISKLLIQMKAERQHKSPKVKRGKMTVKQLAAQNRGMKSVEIPDDGVGSFIFCSAVVNRTETFAGYLIQNGFEYIDNKLGAVMPCRLPSIGGFVFKRNMFDCKFSLVIHFLPSDSVTKDALDTKAQYSSVSSTRKAGDHSRCKCPSCLYACTWRQFLKRLSVIIREAQR